MTDRLQRTVRTRPRNGLAIADVLAGVFASELCSPSPELWLVSGWVSDVMVLDNSSRQFDGLTARATREVQNGRRLLQVEGAFDEIDFTRHLSVGGLDDRSQEVVAKYLFPPMATLGVLFLRAAGER